MTPAVDVQSVSFAYTRGTNVLQSVTLRVDAGERLGILGPNGGGKSTLLKLIMGELTPTSGAVAVMGESPAGARRRGAVGYVAQRADLERAFPLSARQVIDLAATWRLPPWASISSETRCRIDHLVDLVGAGAFIHQPVGTLSGGQLQRVLIARALCIHPQILVLDEPTVGIDAAGQAQFSALLDRLHKELNLTLLVVSHDIRAIAAGCDRVACLSRKLHFHASPQGLTPQVLAEVFAHDIAGLIGAGPLAGMHVHAHGPGEPCPSDASSSPPVQLGLPPKGPKPGGPA